MQPSRFQNRTIHAIIRGLPCHPLCSGPAAPKHRAALRAVLSREVDAVRSKRSCQIREIDRGWARFRETARYFERLRHFSRHHLRSNSKRVLRRATPGPPLAAGAVRLPALRGPTPRELASALHSHHGVLRPAPPAAADRRAPRRGARSEEVRDTRLVRAGLRAGLRLGLPVGRRGIVAAKRAGIRTLTVAAPRAGGYCVNARATAHGAVAFPMPLPLAS